MGAIAALEALKRPVKVVLHADSSYVVKGMNEWIEGWQRNGWRSGREKKAVANKDLWERLLKAAAPHDVTWQWVRGHAGNAENERVDRLANAAAGRANEKDDVSVRVELEAHVGIHCAIAGEGTKAAAPPWCIRGPGHVGVHCLRGDGKDKCPHAFVVLERSSLKLQDRAGGSAALASGEGGKGATVDAIKGVLRGIGQESR